MKQKLPLDWFFPTLGDMMTALSLDILRFFATSLMPSTVLRFGCQHKHAPYELCKLSSSECSHYNMMYRWFRLETLVTTNFVLQFSVCCELWQVSK